MERALQAISLQAPGASFLLRARVFINLRKGGYLDTGLRDRLYSKVINVSYRRHAGAGCPGGAPTIRIIWGQFDVTSPQTDAPHSTRN